VKIETKEVRFSLEELQIKRADIDKKVFRPYLRQIANGIRKSARKKASQKKVSARGEYPGKRSGALAKAIRVRYFKSGYGFKVLQEVPTTGGRIKNDCWQFYPAFLRFGVKRRKKGQKLDSWRIEKRRDYINDAALEHEQGAMDVVMQGLDAALKGMFSK
jgi:hypothetical protein